MMESNLDPSQAGYHVGERWWHVGVSVCHYREQAGRQDGGSGRVSTLYVSASVSHQLVHVSDGTG